MRLLIVDDDAAVLRLVSSRLEMQGVSVTSAATGAAALAELRHGSFDVAILDLTLPDGSGLDLLREIRALEAPTHVIILSGAGSVTDRVEALDLGADDYVVKPCFVRELTARVLAVRRRQDVGKDTLLQHGGIGIDLASRKVTVDDVAVMLTPKEFDLLAFLAARPRHVFSRDELLRAVWQSAADWQQPSTVTEHIGRLRAKIEHDPRHPRLLHTVRGVGYRFDPPVDEVAQAPPAPTTHASPDPSLRLRHLATGVLSEVADAVIVTDPHLHVRSWNEGAERLYGWAEDEVLGRNLFDVVPHAEGNEPLSAAMRALEEKGRWFGEGQHIARDGSIVTVSASTTLLRDELGEPMALVSVNRRAAPVLPLTTGQAHDEADIRRGVDAGEFVVHYQPVVAFADRQLITLEALVRWNHADSGLLLPAAFIDTAERSGVILELGRAVFEQACRQCAEWRRAGNDVTIAVNLSTKQFADAALFGDITEMLSASGLDPHALWLEVTETALVEDLDQATELLQRLAALGIGITIDDFGTGWASLTYLKQFPVHALKIDQSFVAGVDHNPQDAAIARSIISLGNELDMVVVAEGVETVEQQTALESLGCSIGQGFLYGRPVPADEVPLERAHRI